MEGRQIQSEFPERAALVRPSAAPRGDIAATPTGSTELNEGGRSIHSSAPGTGAFRDAVPPSPFTIAEREAERMRFGTCLAELYEKARQAVGDMDLDVRQRIVWDFVLDRTRTAIEGTIPDADPIDRTIDLFMAEQYGAEPI